MGPAGRVGTLGDLRKQAQYIDRSIEIIYNELGEHIKQMTRLQLELDTLRETVRKLPSRS